MIDDNKRLIVAIFEKPIDEAEKAFGDLDHAIRSLYGESFYKQKKALKQKIDHLKGLVPTIQK